MDFMRSKDNTLGWRPLGRDDQGRAMVITELPIPKHPERMRVCRVTLAPEGHIHHYEQIVGGD